jgi:TonB family protein
MAATLLLYRPAMPAWSVTAEDEQRFRRIFRTVLLICLFFALIMPWLPVPKEDRSHPDELPPRLAKLLLERQPPPPLPVIPKQEIKPEAKDVKKPETVKPEAKKEPVPEARQPVPNKPPGEKIEAARRKAAGVGLLAMKDELAELRGAPEAAQLAKDIKPGPGVGSGVGPGVGAGKGAGLPSRALITSNATGGSGGINTGAYSRDTGGGGLAGRATTMVGGVAGGGGGGGLGGGGGGAGGGAIKRGGSGKAARSIEEIRLVFDRNKGSIYAIYNRALREDPSLAGKVVLELTIAASGQVLNCRIVSSELHAADLEAKLIARIRQFDFGAKDVDTMVVTYPLDFLPS